MPGHFEKYPIREDDIIFVEIIKLPDFINNVYHILGRIIKIHVLSPFFYFN